MKSGVTLAFALVAVLLLGTVGSAHHPISAKFDDTKPQTLSGVVTLVDWRNPHVHIYMNVRNNNDADNWAIELESPIDLQASGWTNDSVKPGDAITVTGITARNGSRQLWATRSSMTGTGKEVLHVTPPSPLPCSRIDPPRAGRTSSRGSVRVPVAPRATGPSRRSTVLVETTRHPDGPVGAAQERADAKRVAPMQPWALALYELRQRRFLQDDPDVPQLQAARRTSTISVVLRRAVRGRS
jgi:hypothetical protein